MGDPACDGLLATKMVLSWLGSEFVIVGYFCSPCLITSSILDAVTFLLLPSTFQQTANENLTS